MHVWCTSEAFTVPFQHNTEINPLILVQMLKPPWLKIPWSISVCVRARVFSPSNCSLVRVKPPVTVASVVDEYLQELNLVSSVLIISVFEFRQFINVNEVKTKQGLCFTVVLFVLSSGVRRGDSFCIVQMTLRVFHLVMFTSAMKY